MIITLLSDLGRRDSSVAISKAALMQQVPDAVIVEVTNAVLPGDVQQAAYLLLSAYSSFPKGTVHIVAVGIFAGLRPRMLMVKKDGHYFIAPDNGVLILAFGRELENIRSCFEFDEPCGVCKWIEHAGAVMAAIGEGWVLPYRQTEVSVLPDTRGFKLTPYGIECNVLHIDRYNNVVLAINKKQFERTVGNRPFRISILRLPDIVSVSKHYNDVPEQYPLCWFNSSGYLEIAINRGNAAALLGLDPILPGGFKYKVVRIFFPEQSK